MRMQMAFFVDGPLEGKRRFLRESIEEYMVPVLREVKPSFGEIKDEPPDAIVPHDTFTYRRQCYYTTFTMEMFSVFSTKWLSEHKCAEILVPILQEELDPARRQGL